MPKIRVLMLVALGSLLCAPSVSATAKPTFGPSKNKKTTTQSTRSTRSTTSAKSKPSGVVDYTTSKSKGPRYRPATRSTKNPMLSHEALRSMGWTRGKPFLSIGSMGESLADKSGSGELTGALHHPALVMDNLVEFPKPSVREAWLDVGFKPPRRGDYAVTCGLMGWYNNETPLDVEITLPNKSKRHVTVKRFQVDLVIHAGDTRRQFWRIESENHGWLFLGCEAAELHKARRFPKSNKPR